MVKSALDGWVDVDVDIQRERLMDRHMVIWIDRLIDG